MLSMHWGLCTFRAWTLRKTNLFQGSELGSTRALYGVANAYNSGEGVEKDGKKARHYYELAAMKGDYISRCNLGAEEGIAGDFDKALKHLLISCGRGHMFSLKCS